MTAATALGAAAKILMPLSAAWARYFEDRKVFPVPGPARTILIGNADTIIMNAWRWASDNASSSGDPGQFAQILGSSTGNLINAPATLGVDSSPDPKAPIFRQALRILSFTWRLRSLTTTHPGGSLLSRSDRGARDTSIILSCQGVVPGGKAKKLPPLQDSSPPTRPRQWNSQSFDLAKVGQTLLLNPWANRKPLNWTPLTEAPPHGQKLYFPLQDFRTRNQNQWRK